MLPPNPPKCFLHSTNDWKAVRPLRESWRKVKNHIFSKHQTNFKYDDRIPVLWFCYLRNILWAYYFKDSVYRKIICVTLYNLVFLPHPFFFPTSINMLEGIVWSHHPLRFGELCCCSKKNIRLVCICLWGLKKRYLCPDWGSGRKGSLAGGFYWSWLCLHPCCFVLLEKSFVLDWTLLNSSYICHAWEAAVYSIGEAPVVSRHPCLRPRLWRVLCVREGETLMIQEQLLTNPGSGGNVILFLNHCIFLPVGEIVLSSRLWDGNKEERGGLDIFFMLKSTSLPEGIRKVMILSREALHYWGTETNTSCFKFKDNFSIVRWIY